MDFYYEETREMNHPKKREMLRIFLAFCSAGMMLLGMILVYFSLFTRTQMDLLLFLGFGLAFGIGSVFVWFKRFHLVYDYDYILVNGEMKIVKVISKKARRLKHDVKPLQIGKIGKFGSEDYKSLTKNPKVKVSVASPNPTEEWEEGFYFAVHGAYGTEILCLECSKEFVATLLKAVNRSTLEKGLSYHDLLG